MEKNYKHLKRVLACENSMFEVFFDQLQMRSGVNIDDFLIVRPKIATPSGEVGVCVLPEVNGSILLMKSWRHQLNSWVWQAPAGFINAGEEANETACRELEEETGYICDANNLIHMVSYYPDAGLIEGSVGIFLAKSCKKTDNEKNTGEEVGTGVYSLFNKPALRGLIKNNNVMGGSTLLACCYYLQNYLEN